MASNGFLPAWVLANEAWPGVCQSWVMTMLSKAEASLLITGTTCAPPFTGSVPPSTKQFWTSTTTNAVAAPGLMPAAKTGRGRPVAPTKPAASMTLANLRRDRSGVGAVMGAPQLILRDSSPAKRRVPLSGHTMASIGYGRFYAECREFGDLTIRTWLRALGRPTVLVLGCGLGLAGCQAVPGDGPWMNGAKSTSTEALPFDVIDLTPTTVIAYRSPATVDRPSATGELSAGGRVSVAPGDVLKVRIFEPYEGSIFPTIQKPGAELGNQRVTDAGTIEVPYVGRVKVAGLDLRQIEERVVEQLGTKTQNPQVIVEFVADRTNTVMISGDVKTPGRLSLLEGTRSVVDAVNKVGGAVGAANQLEIVVRRHGNVILDKQYSDLLAGADIAIEKGDEIVVRPNSQVFTVLGAVAKAGNVQLSKPNMTLHEALGAVNGLSDERANKTGVYLFRMGDVQDNPSARARVFRLDLMQPVSIFVAQQFGMQAKDVIYVTNAPLYEYNKVLTALYRTLSIVGVARGTLTTTTTF